MAKKHIHKYHKVNIGYTKVWACALPNCSHHMPHNMEDLVIGKSSFCWECNNPIVLDEINMQVDKPICRVCKHSHLNINI